jgi:ABC-2 type transport system permease protein
VFRIALRLQRTGMIAMAVLGPVGGLIQAVAFSSAAGTTEAARHAFGQQMTFLGHQISYLLPLPVGVDTLAGYVQWRVYGAFSIVVLIWAVMSASGATRGDEERGLVEEWLGRGVGRVGYLGIRFLAFSLAATIFVVFAAAAVDAGAAGAGSPVDLGALVGVSAALLGLTLACYAISLVASQVVATRNAAAGLSAGVLLAMFFVNSFSRTLDSLRPFARLTSPFYYYDRVNPLAPGGGFDLPATLGLFAAAVILAGVAAWLMQRRDLGAPLIRRRAGTRPAVHDPSRNPMLGLPVLSSLYEQRTGLIAWTLGSAAGAALFASLGRQIVDLASSTSGGLRGYLALVGHGDPYVVLTGFFWFGIFQLLLAVYAITQVARWAAEDNEGRLEMELSAPVPRWRVVVERAVALLVAMTLVIGVSSVSLYVEAHLVSINMPSSDLVLASVLLIPFGTSFAAIGAVLASRVPRASVAVLGTIAGLSYLVVQVAPLFNWPDWVLKTSIFTLYGAPLSDGVKWDGLWEMLAICALGFGLATILMQRREVGS